MRSRYCFLRGGGFQKYTQTDNKTKSEFHFCSPTPWPPPASAKLSAERGPGRPIVRSIVRPPDRSFVRPSSDRPLERELEGEREREIEREREGESEIESEAFTAAPSTNTISESNFNSIFESFVSFSQFLGLDFQTCQVFNFSSTSSNFQSSGFHLCPGWEGLGGGGGIFLIFACVFVFFCSIVVGWINYVFYFLVICGFSFYLWGIVGRNYWYYWLAFPVAGGIISKAISPLSSNSSSNSGGRTGSKGKSPAIVRGKQVSNGVR